MKKVSIVGIFIALGLLILLKVFQDSIPVLNSIQRIDEPISNLIIFLVFIVGGVFYGVSLLKKRDNQ